MELIDYLKTARKNMVTIVAATFLTAVITAFVTLLIPKTYTSKAILQSDVTFSIPALRNASMGEQQDARIAYYQAMVDNDNFNSEIVKKLAKRGVRLVSDNFTVGLDSVNGSKLVALEASTRSNPPLAKKIADASAEVLVYQVDRLKISPAKSKAEIQKKINILNASIKKIRIKLTKIKEKMEKQATHPLADTMKLRGLQDELMEAGQKRKAYQDYYNYTEVDEVVTEKGLKIVYPANISAKPSRPNILNNILFGALAGFFIGLGFSALSAKDES